MRKTRVKPSRASSSYHNQEVLKPRKVSWSAPEKAQVAAPMDIPDLEMTKYTFQHTHTHTHVHTHTRTHSA